MRTRVPVALAKRSRVRVEGLTRPPRGGRSRPLVLPNALGRLASCHPALGARFDQGRGEGKLRLQRLVLGAKGRSFSHALATFRTGMCLLLVSPPSLGARSPQQGALIKFLS